MSAAWQVKAAERLITPRSVEVPSKGEGNVGGLVGRVLGVSDKETVITNSYASVDVTGTGIGGVGSGGLVGYIRFYEVSNSLVEIKNSYASGDVTDTGDIGGSGGLVGIIRNEKTQEQLDFHYEFVCVRGCEGRSEWRRSGWIYTIS